MHVLWRGDVLQRARLVSGLILFTFAATHFLNHALGLFGVDVMEDMRGVRLAITRSVPGSIVLGLALATHIGLALYKLANRTTLKLPKWELTQLLLGLAIPFLLFPHIINTRIAHTFYGVNDNYLYELARLWPDGAALQSLLLLFVWTHGCVGIHFWLRLYAPYRRIQPVLLALALLVPVAALGGFMVSGRGVAVMIEDPKLLTKVKEVTSWPSDDDNDRLAYYRTLVRVEYGVVLAVIFASFGVGYFLRRSGPKVRVTYLGGPTHTVPQGPSLLEISRMKKVPHASICGGRARCSTCRVRIEKGSTDLPPPSFPENVTLGSIGAPGNIRLACQIHPAGRVIVSRILRASTTGPTAAATDETNAGGVEKRLAVMFVDMRGFTRLAENRLPFDVVYILNEFFGAIGTAITQNGGRIDKFIGDGLLAVFGEHSSIEIGCREALRTARAIDIALDHVNAKLTGELGRPVEVGVGIDAGTLVLGRIGFGDSVDFTVIGNPVNIASRLESLTKEHRCQIMVSGAVAEKAGWIPETEFKTKVAVRGVAEPVDVIGIVRGRDLPASILTLAADENEGRKKTVSTPA